MATYTQIKNLLEGKTLEERGTIKGAEIASFDFRGTFTEGNLTFEVTGIAAITGGIEIFARVWKDGVQLGFGSDGSVDIERFRFFNPPLLINDQNGTITTSYVDDITGQTVTRKMRFAPLIAIKQALAHTAICSGKEGTTIIAGKIGNTTSTFYAGAGDGSATTDSVYGTWAGAHDATNGSSASYTLANDVLARSQWDGGSSKFNIARAFTPFDTSAIPDTDTISSATYSLFAISIRDGDNDGQDYIGIVQTTQASNTSLVSEDYDQCGAVSNPTQGATAVDITGMSTSAYTDWTLNATGLSWISKTGYTLLGAREGHDIENSAISSSVTTTNDVRFYSSEQTGTTNDPKLVVVHSTGTQTTARKHTLLMMGVG